MGRITDFGRKYGTCLVTEAETDDNYIASVPRPDELPLDEDTGDVVDLNIVENVYRRSFLRDLSSKKAEALTSETSVMRSLSWIKIDKIVYEKDVYFTDCLSMIYSSLYETADTIALLVSKYKGGSISLYLGVNDKKCFKNFVSRHILHKSVEGNLPGLSFTESEPILDERAMLYVASASGVASLRGDKKQKFSQGIERIVNATEDIPSFTILLLARNIDAVRADDYCSEARKTYSALSRISELTLSTSKSHGTTVNETVTTGTNQSKTQSMSTTDNTSDSTNESTTDTKTEGGGKNVVIANTSDTKSHSTTNGTTSTKGSSSTQGSSETTGESLSRAKAEGTSDNFGSSEQIKRENKQVKDLMARIDRLISRYAFSQSLGLWDFAAYFLADTRTTAISLASIYKGIVTGGEDGGQIFAVNSWNTEGSSAVKEHILNYDHPMFRIGGELVSPAVPATSEELAVNMSFPQSSIPGVLVREQVSFGRNIISDERDSGTRIRMGSLYHLGRICKGSVDISENMLASHTFVTGSTGSGKSNTIYHLLNQLVKHGKHFLVIEPAKGEYKNVFGGYDGVSVFSTNPYVAELLRINPFSFPKDIHVAEHIDRLIDIFNACWPMYAAMPSVLKESISRAYVACGWNLRTSVSEYGFFPTVTDVVDELNSYIDSSEYSSDSKGDYKGALGTRLQSLTNGIVGQVFAGRETEAERLFNGNTIVDLSRVGSAETKSLIMGFLVMKLNEFRISENKGMNLPLQHVTVLEEAHNLLRQTSSVQSQESANLIGKSVEMISSAIAEMRTYGEGFIIADQSPSMLDRAAISNTNTKIIMALPDRGDREQAAYSVGLNDSQVQEISRLRTGVAVVCQKGWEEPVLCKIDRFEDFRPYRYDAAVKPDKLSDEECMLALYNGYSGIKDLKAAEMRCMLKNSSFSGKKKARMLELIEKDDTVTSDICAKMFVHVVGENLFLSASKKSSLQEFNKVIRFGLESLASKGVSGHMEAFMSMYVKGCSLMNTSQFYDAWFKQTLISKENQK